jgi:hypothetical protein
MEFWPPARREFTAYASERVLDLVELDLFLHEWHSAENNPPAEE